jgi:adenine phosphoribosyltransferase
MTNLANAFDPIAAMKLSLKKGVREVPDFPKPGILFKDIFPLLANPKTHREVTEALLHSLNLDQVDLFVGIEARGFILASALAAQTGKGFAPARKAGKLPPPTVRQKYDLEYGTAELELAQGSGRVVIVDDVLATGGTLRATIDLCAKAGYDVVDISVLINLKYLNNFRFHGEPVKSVIDYE